MPTSQDAARTFLAGVLAKLPESQRAQAEAVFNHAEAAAALDEIGAGVLRQSDYSRSMDAARAESERATALYNQNKQWWDANSAEVAEAARLREELASRETATPTPPADNGRPPADAPSTRRSRTCRRPRAMR